MRHKHWANQKHVKTFTYTVDQHQSKRFIISIEKSALTTNGLQDLVNRRDLYKSKGFDVDVRIK